MIVGAAGYGNPANDTDTCIANPLWQRSEDQQDETSLIGWFGGQSPAKTANVNKCRNRRNHSRGYCFGMATGANMRALFWLSAFSKICGIFFWLFSVPPHNVDTHTRSVLLTPLTVTSLVTTALASLDTPPFQCFSRALTRASHTGHNNDTLAAVIWLFFASLSLSKHIHSLHFITTLHGDFFGVPFSFAPSPVVLYTPWFSLVLSVISLFFFPRIHLPSIDSVGMPGSFLSGEESLLIMDTLLSYGSVFDFCVFNSRFSICSFASYTHSSHIMFSNRTGSREDIKIG